MMKKSERFSSVVKLTGYGNESIRDNFIEKAKQKSVDYLTEIASFEDDCSFCTNFPVALRSFVATIIQSSLNRIYDDEIGVLADEPKPKRDYSRSSKTLSEFDTYNLIDTSLETMLTPSKKVDGSVWAPNAKLQDYDYLPPNILWPNNEDFNPELGARKIKTYIKSWELTCGWVYTLNTLPLKERRFWTEYNYEARFSIPTRRQPVPKYTVSVFFTIKKARCKPRGTPVEVSYVIESFSQAHRPGEHVFSEESLKMVLEYKAKLREKLGF